MIYLDNAATTKVYNDVIYLLHLYSEELYFNPSAMYGDALKVGRGLQSARETIADALGCKPAEIIFTGSGTESDNTAIFGSVKSKERRILCCVAEHAAVYQSFLELKNRGYHVEFIGTNLWGGADLDEFAKKLTPDTQFVSVMHVNNETGAINDISRFARTAKEISPKCIFHSDGVQAFGKLPLDVHALGVDLYSFSAHKIHGPKGVGGLYVRRGVNLPPLLYGGGQESGYRSGTENVAGIVAFQKACEITMKDIMPNAGHFKKLKTIFLETLIGNLPEIKINSPQEKTVDYIVNVSIAGCKAEVLMHLLEQDGILIGLGSACSARHRTGRITKALGLTDEYAEGTIRISFSSENTAEEVSYAAERIAKHGKDLRRTIRRTH